VYRFKRAETQDELDQVFRLNHDTFARELRQHSAHEDGRLIDRFHDKNTYYIAIAGDRVVGMIAVHDQPPFSVAARMADPNLLGDLGRILEVRLLAVDPEHRSQMVIGGLFWEVLKHGRTGGHETVAISGIVEQQRMYKRMGFNELGPPVQSGEAWFIPMAGRLRELEERNRAGVDRYLRRVMLKRNDAGSS
jgi:predicted N-acetyltransferase YhbS